MVQVLLIQPRRLQLPLARPRKEQVCVSFCVVSFNEKCLAHLLEGADELAMDFVTRFDLSAEC